MAKKVTDRSKNTSAKKTNARSLKGDPKPSRMIFRELDAAIGDFAASDSDVRGGEIDLVYRESREKGPAWLLVRRATHFLGWLYLTAPGHPKLVAAQEAIQGFLQDFFFARYVLSAMEETPRRNVTGKEGALEQLGKVVSRSSAYNFLKENLGISDLDAFRRCRTMEDVVRLSPRLREKLEIVEHLYDVMFRARHPDMPPLFELDSSKSSDESELAGTTHG